MRTREGNIIPEREIARTLRTCDATRIYALYHRIHGGDKIRLADVMDFIKRHAPSHRAMRRAIDAILYDKHGMEALNIERECIRRHGLYMCDIRHRVVEYLKEQCSLVPSPYCKRPMVHDSNLFFCSPHYGIKDYNKWMAMPIEGNERFVDKVIKYADKFFNPFYGEQ